MPQLIDSKKILKSDIEHWFIAHSNDKTVVHHGHLGIGQQAETGQAVLLCYDTEQEWIDDLLVLGIDITQEKI